MAKSGNQVHRTNSQSRLSVIGHAAVLFNAAQLLIDSVNSDPKVSLVLHVGDIHSGVSRAPVPG
jgi:hypothetical protein